ncbi:D-alanine--poly(phosphoribitol) ligase subunit DltC [Bacillus sp. FJAT-29790]|uniref:D-alanine--poly(phosphoribitol) ligase subunit DltC n=1 Tax=Bacillus sp. FJAT-29790 TaxID=1895002 RepID=UPI001C243597|nr:D-alanine--poly(phosphoribitol) ligase subunit DltC [Bacillus sp. FJAT-29790]MBU8878827.1 D-alanine--poly(phosphoribitol) ligase subunit DltC [Bacillus sp. FJAT-29790]
MTFTDQVIALVAEVCQDDIVKDDPNIDLFDAGLLDSIGTVELLVLIEERFGINVPITEFDRETWATPNKIAERIADFK